MNRVTGWTSVAPYLFLLIICTSCKKEEPHFPKETMNAEGVVIAKDYLWKTDVSGKGLIWPSVTPAFYKNTVVVGGESTTEQDILVGLDIESGEKQWEWKDFLTKDHTTLINPGDYDINQKDNMWFLQDGPYTYAVDLSNGTTIRKEKQEDIKLVDGVQIVGDSFYQNGGTYVDSTEVQVLFKGSVYQQGYQAILKVPIDTIQYFQNIYGLNHKPLIYKENGELHAFLQFNENVNVYQSKMFNYVASYNLTAGKYDFKKTRLGDTVNLPFGGRPALYKNLMIINADQELYGIDKLTGKTIWHRDDFPSLGDGVFTYGIYDDKLIAVNKVGAIDRVMAFDPMTGQTLWQDIGRGNSAETIHFLNGVLYFASRGDGHVYAYDVKTGALLWDLRSPDSEVFQGYGGFRVIPGKEGEKGKIIACTYLNAYCYVAIR